jgi:hypothetical protein
MFAKTPLGINTLGPDGPNVTLGIATHEVGCQIETFRLHRYCEVPAWNVPNHIIMGRRDRSRVSASGIGPSYLVSYFFTRQGVKRRIVLHLHVLFREKDAAMRELPAVQVNRPFLSDRSARSHDSQNGKAKTHVDGPTHLTIPF